MKRIILLLSVLSALLVSCNQSSMQNSEFLYTTDGCNIALDGVVYTAGNYSISCGFHEFTLDGDFLFDGMTYSNMHFFAEEGRLRYEE